MFLSSKDLILRDKVQLHNNLAEVNGLQGRLLAELEIWPRGRLMYDFQVLEEHSHNPALPLSNAFEEIPYLPIHSRFFSIDKPGYGGVRFSEGPSTSIYGNTARATTGDPTDEAHAFDFYLPNTKFQCLEGVCKGLDLPDDANGIPQRSNR